MNGSNGPFAAVSIVSSRKGLIVVGLLFFNEHRAISVKFKEAISEEMDLPMTWSGIFCGMILEMSYLNV